MHRSEHVPIGGPATTENIGLTTKTRPAIEGVSFKPKRCGIITASPIAHPHSTANPDMDTPILVRGGNIFGVWVLCVCVRELGRLFCFGRYDG